MNIGELIDHLDTIDAAQARPGFEFKHLSRCGVFIADRQASLACPLAFEVPITAEAFETFYAETAAYQTGLVRAVAERESSLGPRLGRA